jgi:hypothetical protein
MSGIKSAIELAMERTKNLVMTQEERKSLAMKEMENRIRAVVRRYLEGFIESDGVNKEILGVEGDEKSKMLVLTDVMVDEFDVKERNERLLDLLGHVATRASEPLGKDLEGMREVYVRQIEGGKPAVHERILGRLKEMGITGGAVEPNAEEWDEWGESIKAAGEAFRQRIAEWKDKLKADINK